MFSIDFRYSVSKLVLLLVDIDRVLSLVCNNNTTGFASSPHECGCEFALSMSYAFGDWANHRYLNLKLLPCQVNAEISILNLVLQSYNADHVI
jgi:hypothetical protein